MRMRMEKLNARKLVIGLIPWFHCVLIFAPLYAMVMRIIYGGNSTDYFLGGFLLILPIAAIFLGIHFLKHMWQYLLYAALLAAVTQLAAGDWIAFAIVTFLAFIKFLGRLTDSQTIFDAPHLPAAIIFLIPAVYAGIAVEPQLQILAVLLAFIYIVMNVVYNGLIRLDNYIDMNSGINDFPAKRIGRSGGVVFGIGAVMVLAVIIPVLLMNFKFIPVHINMNAPRESVGTQITNDMEGSVQKDDWMKYIDETVKPVVDLSFLGDIAMVAAGVLTAALIAYGIYSASRSFRRTVSEKNDVIESTAGGGEALSARKKSGKLKLLDFSPNVFIRRKYMKTIKKAKKAAPDEWLAPEEIESFAGVENKTLHHVYEKARYSREGCTAEDKNLLQ